MEIKVAIKLAELRKSKNFTQEKLAEEFNISRSKVSSWETNNRDMSITEAIKLAKLYDVSLDNLFENNEINEKEYIKISEKFLKNNNISLKEKVKVIENIRQVLKHNNIDDFYEYFKNDTKCDKIT